MLKFGNKEFRNLQEQVEKNMKDILFILQEEGVLNEFGIKVVGQEALITNMPTVEDYKEAHEDWSYGDTYAIGTEAPYTLYVLTRANGTHPNDYWFNIGRFPVAGPQGPQGPQGEVGPQGQTGNPGTDGAAAGFGTVTATAITLEPDEEATASVVTSGPNTEKSFAFTFGIPKGGSGGGGGTDAVWGNITGDISNQTDLISALQGKQNTLVSGTNIKTISGNSILGSGNIKVSQLQATATVVIDALTNLNGRILSNYEAYLDTTTSYTYYVITKGGNQLTEEQARDYMEYMTGSRFLPVFDYETPENSLFVFANGSLWKPQFDNEGLKLYALPNPYASKLDLNTKQNTLVSGSNIKTINNESLLGSGNIEVAGKPSVSDFTAGPGIVIDEDLANDTVSIEVDQASIPFKVDLSTVAFSGSYNDLSNKPSIPDISNLVTLDTAQTITGAKSFSSPILPTTNNSLDLGNSSKRWQHLYLGGSIIWGSSYIQQQGTSIVINPSGTSVSANADNAKDLGNGVRRWRNLYLAGNLSDGTNSIAVADIATKSELSSYVDLTSAQTITSTKTFVREIDFKYSDSSIYKTGIVCPGNNKLGFGNAPSSASGINSYITMDFGSKIFYPGQNGQYSLGTINSRWKDLYLSGNLSDGTNSVSVAQIASGLGETYRHVIYIEGSSADINIAVNLKSSTPINTQAALAAINNSVRGGTATLDEQGSYRVVTIDSVGTVGAITYLDETGQHTLNIVDIYQDVVNQI